MDLGNKKGSWRQGAPRTFLFGLFEARFAVFLSFFRCFHHFWGSSSIFLPEVPSFPQFPQGFPQKSVDNCGKYWGPSAPNTAKCLFRPTNRKFFHDRTEHGFFPKRRSKRQLVLPYFRVILSYFFLRIHNQYAAKPPPTTANAPMLTGSHERLT